MDGSLKFREYNLGLIPVDNDILSMELQDTFRSNEISGDQTTLYYVARLCSTCSMYITPKLYAKGPMSRAVIELVTRLRSEEFAAAGRGEEEDIPLKLTQCSSGPWRRHGEPAFTPDV